MTKIIIGDVNESESVIFDVEDDEQNATREFETFISDGCTKQEKWSGRTAAAAYFAGVTASSFFASLYCTLPKTRPWLLLCLTIIFEVGGTFCMKIADGFSHVIPSILVFVFYFTSLGMFTFTLKDLPMSTAYT